MKSNSIQVKYFNRHCTNLAFNKKVCDICDKWFTNLSGELDDSYHISKSVMSTYTVIFVRPKLVSNSWWFLLFLLILRSSNMRSIYRMESSIFHTLSLDLRALQSLLLLLLYINFILF